MGRSLDGGLVVMLTSDRNASVVAYRCGCEFGLEEVMLLVPGEDRQEPSLGRDVVVVM